MTEAQIDFERREGHAGPNPDVDERRHRDELPPPVSRTGGGGAADSLNYFADLVLDQAKALYRYWPDIEGRPFA